MSASSMRAVQATKAGSALVTTSLPVPEPGPWQVRVKAHACGVCGVTISRASGYLACSCRAYSV